jgi:hypothetical protein
MTFEGSDDLALAKLLAPLDRLQPARLRRPPSRRPRKRLAVVAAVIAALSGAVAVAASSWGPFANIEAVQHPATATDKLPSAVVAQLRTDEAPPGSVDQIGKRLVGDARHLGVLADGYDVYAVPTSKGKLCVVVALLSESCGEPLTHERPLTMTVVERGPGSPPVVWGAAADGVESVSFRVGGTLVQVPTRGDAYTWQGTAAQAQASISDVTATFSDGSTVPAR